MEWISVEDRLPEVGTFVLVVFMKENTYRRIPVTGVRRFGGLWNTINWYSGDTATGITHWMPLPDQPD